MTSWKATRKPSWDDAQDGVGGLTGDTKTQAKGKLNEAAGSLQSAYGRVKDRTQDAVEQAIDQTQGVYEDITQFLRGRPVVGVGIGMDVGLLLALALGGGRRTIYLKERGN